MGTNEIIRVYHTGFEKIKVPDVNYGRSNADFGQGFYLSSNEEFAQRWAGERQNCTTYINYYELNLSGLEVVRFDRDEKWFDYIFKNRFGYADAFAQADVIIGPIANDTLYDTYGLITSGFLPNEEALKLLQIGPSYVQIAIKSEKAVSQLKWISSRILMHDEIAALRSQVRQEEQEYQKEFGEGLKQLPNFAEIDEMLS